MSLRPLGAWETRAVDRNLRIADWRLADSRDPDRPPVPPFPGAEKPWSEREVILFDQFTGARMDDGLADHDGHPPDQSTLDFAITQGSTETPAKYLAATMPRAG